MWHQTGAALTSMLISSLDAGPSMCLLLLAQVLWEKALELILQLWVQQHKVNVWDWWSCSRNSHSHGMGSCNRLCCCCRLGCHIELLGEGDVVGISCTRDRVSRDMPEVPPLLLLQQLSKEPCPLLGHRDRCIGFLPAMEPGCLAGGLGLLSQSSPSWSPPPALALGALHLNGCRLECQASWRSSPTLGWCSSC